MWKRSWSFGLPHVLIGFLLSTALLLALLNSEALFPTLGFDPHGHCFLWQPRLLWTFVGTDLFTGLSYTAIAGMLVYLVQQARQEIPFNWMVVAFGTFIFACGLTHFLDVWTIWYPDYWVSAGVRFVTAVASVTTALALPPLIPRLLRLIADAKVSRERKAQLETAVQNLEWEIAERKRAEDEVRRLNAELEQRVHERTLELQAANREKDDLLAREKVLRAEAEAAGELKLKFLGMVSHELRTPLASIKGFTSTLLAKDVTWDAANQNEFIQIMDEEADKLTELVSQLLDVSRLHAGTLSIQPQPERLLNIVEQARAQLSALTVKHQLVFDLPPGLPLVMADHQRIAQVITNLVDNAAKYSPEGTTIRLSAQQQSDFVQVDVSDQGAGIPAAARETVFEAFQQIERKFGNQRGAGLGLAICKGLVEQHGGRIWIQDGDRPGTTISFTLPVVR